MSVSTTLFDFKMTTPHSYQGRAKTDAEIASSERIAAEHRKSIPYERIIGTEDEGRKIVAHALMADYKKGKLEVTDTIVGFGFENPGSDDIDVRIYDTRGVRTVLRRIDVQQQIKKATP